MAQSYRDLKESHEKIVKREKKREKFFTKIWKGVKGTFKVLKPKEQLPSLRFESDDEAPAEWSSAKDYGIDEES